MKDIAYCNTQFKRFAKYFNGFVEKLREAQKPAKSATKKSATKKAAAKTAAKPAAKKTTDK